MSRLTLRDKNGKANPQKKVNHQDLIEKLAHYEDLEEQGRLIELPCSVGDTVYGYWIDGKNSAVYDYKPPNEPACILVKDLWRKKFFGSKEEAEAKLAELKGTEE